MTNSRTAPTESVLALVALGKVDRVNAAFYKRSIAHLVREGLIEFHEASGKYRVASTEDAGVRSPSQPPPAPPLETLVTRVSPAALAEIDALVEARGSTRSEIAREVVAAGLRALAGGSGMRRAVRAG